MIRQFSIIFNSKIVIYGTGVVAKKLIEELKPRTTILGVLDKNKKNGNFCGFPILSWELLYKSTDIFVVIASARKNCVIILERIRKDCISRGYRIISSWGEDITNKSAFDINRQFFITYSRYTKEDLIKEIGKHDCISFDIFDTLIMRKIFEPEDLFYLVENKLVTISHKYKGFAIKRIEVGMRCTEGNIYDIYDLIQNMMCLTLEETSVAMQTELDFEKKVIVRRNDIVDVFSWAKENKKHICLISDMYLPKDIIVSFLDELGIYGYEMIYVSCEYGTRKKGNLYDKYRENYDNHSFLHIGDNYESDYLSAREHGIDSFRIMSAREMFSYSPLYRTLVMTNQWEDRLLLGMIVESLFNSPFTMFNSYGAIRIDTWKKWGDFFLLPIIIKYLYSLINYLEMKRIDGDVLFVARDGWLFYRMYELLKSKKNITDLPRGKYLLTSRKSAMKLSSDVDSVIEYLIGIEEGDNLQKLSKKYLSIDIEGEEYKNNIDKIKEYIKTESINKKKNYERYLLSEGIDRSKTNVFCEFFSRGTTQYFLQELFNNKLNGYYFCKYYSTMSFSVDIDSVYVSFSNNSDVETFCKYEFLYEFFLSSLKPSLCEIDDNLNYCYESEVRNDSQKYIIESVQNSVCKSFEDFIDYCTCLAISDEMVIALIQCVDDVLWDNECSCMNSLSLTDSFSKKKLRFF